MKHNQKLLRRHYASPGLQKTARINNQSNVIAVNLVNGVSLNYTYNAYKIGVIEQIDELFLNTLKDTIFKKVHSNKIT